jgi:hypothetical protein
MTFFGFPISALWIAFACLWVFSSETLGHVFTWIQGLPLVLEIIVWIVFLPWVGSLWIWHSSWALGLKILVIVVIALVTLGGSRKRNAAKRARTGR